MALSNSGTKNKDAKETVTFEEAMDIVGTGYFQIKLAIIGGLVILSSYFAIGAVTFPLPGAACDLKIDYEERGTLASISFIGLIITCHMWGFLSDTLGRRYILLRCLICDALLYVLTMLSANFYVILFLRLLNGVASSGGVASIYAYIGEFQTLKFRSRALMISCFVATSSYVLLPAMAWLIIPIKWQFDLYPGLTIRSWRLYYIACGIPSFISTILLFFLPESPKFLLAKGENDKVIEILRKMYKINHKTYDGFNIKNVKMIDDERVGKLDDNKNKVLAVFQLVWNQTVPLLKKPYRFNFIVLSVSLFICFFCNNAMYVWLPEAINRMELYKNVTGNDKGSFCEVLDVDNYINKVVSLKPAYNNSEFTMNGISRKLLSVDEPVCYDEIDTSVYLDYIIFGVTEMAVWIVINAIIKYVNKKYLILFLMTCTLISTISMKWSNVLILMPIKACSIIVFTAGVFPILNSVVVDLFPTNLRAMAGCLTLMASRIGTVVTHEVTGFLIKSHCRILTWNYIILTGVCLVLLFFLPSSPPQQSSSSTKIDQEKHSDDPV